MIQRRRASNEKKQVPNNSTLASAAILAGSVAGATAAAAGTSTVPSNPTGLTATPGNTTVTLSWGAPSNNGGTAVLGYNVYEATTAGGENHSSPGNGNILIVGTNAIVRGLTNGRHVLLHRQRG